MSEQLLLSVCVLVGWCDRQLSYHHRHLAAASKAYNQLVKGSPEWQALQDKWLEQKNLPNGKRFFRGYCISQYMQQAAKENS